MFDALEEAAEKYPSHAVEVHVPSKRGDHKRGISESTPGPEREVEGERQGRTHSTK
jgi:hypothetical protein